MLSANVKAPALACGVGTRVASSLEDELKYSCLFTAVTFRYTHRLYIKRASSQVTQRDCFLNFKRSYLTYSARKMSFCTDIYLILCVYTQFTPLSWPSFTEQTHTALSLTVIYLLLDVNVSESEKTSNPVCEVLQGSGNKSAVSSLICQSRNPGSYRRDRISPGLLFTAQRLFLFITEKPFTRFISWIRRHELSFWLLLSLNLLLDALTDFVETHQFIFLKEALLLLSKITWLHFILMSNFRHSTNYK